MTIRFSHLWRSTKRTVWCELVADFGKLFKTVTSNPCAVDEYRSCKTQHRFRLPHRIRDLIPTGQEPSRDQPLF
ncbi:hypothetical protein Pla52n_39010 [Stieleria varia]|uniref:Uncharacterized protein n=1 Tax=Stieleria varia TaxID=2528005 RepID=A0A5C6ATU6_9BACT|nr:hypothetical protein Pla52n_39010 [Stieleria varia]